MSDQYKTEFYIKQFADLLDERGTGEDILISSLDRDAVDPEELVELGRGEAIIRVEITFTDVTDEYM